MLIALRNISNRQLRRSGMFQQMGSPASHYHSAHTELPDYFVSSEL